MDYYKYIGFHSGLTSPLPRAKPVTTATPVCAWIRILLGALYFRAIASKISMPVTTTFQITKPQLTLDLLPPLFKYALYTAYLWCNVRDQEMFTAHRWASLGQTCRRQSLPSLWQVTIAAAAAMGGILCLRRCMLPKTEILRERRPQCTQISSS